MKLKDEIIKEIESQQKTIENYKLDYKDGKISKDILGYKLTDCRATIEALS